MHLVSFEKTGGLSLVIGSVLFAAYSLLFPVVLPVKVIGSDFVSMVLAPAWLPLAWIAFVGILFMLVGFYAAYYRTIGRSGFVGAAAILCVELAFLLQASKITWEIFLYPVIASNPASQFLLREDLIWHDPSVTLFRTVSAIVIFIGILLFSFSLFRSGEYSKTACFCVASGAILYAVGPAVSVYLVIAGIFIHAAGCMLLGISLMKPPRLNSVSGKGGGKGSSASEIHARSSCSE